MSHFLSEYNKLKNTQKQLEKFQFTIIEQFEKWEGEEIQNLVQLFHKNRTYNFDETDTKSEIKEILKKLKYVKRAVIYENGNNIPDLQAFQKDLVNLINTIQNIKVYSKLKVQELQTEASYLGEDVRFYNEKMSYWSEPVQIEYKKIEVPAKVDSKSNYNNMPKDVKKFIDFVKRSKGHENGWNTADHTLFLKLRKKHKNIDELATKINGTLPDISIEEVKKHAIWYNKYIDLKEKHNEAIKSWQKSRVEIKETDLAVADLPINPDELEKNSVDCIKSIEKKAVERRKVKEGIESWKKEREIMGRIQNSLKVEEILQSKEKEKKNEEINKFKKQIVKEWKEKRIAAEEKEKNTEEVKNLIENNIRTSVANKMIKLYQEQDKMLLEKKKNNQNKNEKQTVNKVPRNFCEVERDPKRLFKPTEQWIHRFLSKNQQVPNNSVNFITHIPKLRVPSWRKEL